MTECPYCGQRVRKRAPKLERSPEDDQPRAKRRRRPRLSRLRANEIEGIAPETRPTATLALILISLLVSVVFASDELGIEDVGAVVPGYDEPWRYVTAPFVHGTSLGYAFVALVAVGVFGSLIERRFGAVLLVIVFLASGPPGSRPRSGLESVGEPFEGRLRVLGANGAALGLLAAWLVDDRRALRSGDDRGSDMIGVFVFAAVLLLLPLAVDGASAVAGVVGALTGAVLGLALPLLRR